VLVETLIRELLGLRAHRVVAVEQDAEQMVIRIERLGRCRLRCRGGVAGPAPPTARWKE
jgi:hypothetical protein